jgi:imidazolonepropionase-like amidohydrolase/ABC-type multidrug transport system permease subunit
MKAYLALILMNLRLALRERSVIFFNYFFPLIFFFAFAQFMGGSTGGSMMTRIVAMVLVIGVLGSGLFGAGMRSVMERETGILRRYRVTPISPLPILISSLVTGWILYMPALALIFTLSHYFYGMPWPERPLSLVLLITLGCFAFRAIGLIIAAVANSMAESNILIQILYMPMLFLSGATIPLSSMPATAQIISQFLPASYLNSGVQHVLLRSRGLATNLESVGALLLTTILATWISMKLFRWEKDEKLPNSAKAWVLAVLLPFVAMGIYQSWSREHLTEAKNLERQIRRNYSRLIRGARIVVGDGTVIASGGILLKDGRIAAIYTDTVPDADSLSAEAFEAAGKTVLPGLIDTHIHLGSPGGVIEPGPDFDIGAAMERALASYIYSGVTTVSSAGDFTAQILAVKKRIAGGERTGAELHLCGPLFTAKGGHGTEYFRKAPEFLRKLSEQEFTRTPESSEQARQAVADLKRDGVNCIKAVLDQGAGGTLFARLDTTILRAIGEAAREHGLPLAVHTGDARDVADAIDAGATSIEHGSAREPIPEELFTRMREKGIYYSPALSALEAFLAIRERKADLLARSLVQQVAPAGLIEATRNAITSASAAPWRAGLENYPIDFAVAQENLRRAHKSGVALLTGSDAGNFLVIHGPSVQREVELWVKAGIPAPAALQAATGNGALRLKIGNRTGFLREGLEATMVVVDGNPLEDPAALEHISSVFLQGERVDRADLFDQH